MRRPRAIILDMDGLMLDTESIYRLAWQQAAAELGYSISDSVYASFVGLETEMCKAILTRIYGDQFPLTDFVARGRQIRFQHIATHGIPVKPGLAELLDFADSCQIHTATATSSRRSNVLFSLGKLADRVQILVTRDDVIHGKPAPDLYLAAAHRLGLAPQDCLALEDSDTGAQSAIAAGIDVIIVPDLIQPSPDIAAQAICVCKSLHQVHALLRDAV